SKEKELYFSDSALGFVSYRVANKYAVVLDEPVCHWTDKEDIIQEFDQFCHKQGLKSIYFRVSEDNLFNFQNLRKNKLLIGIEGIMEISQFSLNGKARTSLRNGMNFLEKNGYHALIHNAPHGEKFLKELKRSEERRVGKECGERRCS